MVNGRQPLSAETENLPDTRNRSPVTGKRGPPIADRLPVGHDSPPGTGGSVLSDSGLVTKGRVHTGPGGAQPDCRPGPIAGVVLAADHELPAVPRTGTSSLPAPDNRSNAPIRAFSVIISELGTQL